MGYSSYYQLVLKWNLIGFMCSQLCSLAGLVVYKQQIYQALYSFYLYCTCFNIIYKENHGQPVVELQMAFPSTLHQRGSILTTYKNIKVDGIAEEIDFWLPSVVCLVLGAKPPLPMMDRFVRRIQKDIAVDRIGMIGRGVYLVRFDFMDNIERALNMIGCISFFIINLSSSNFDHQTWMCTEKTLVTSLKQKKTWLACFFFPNKNLSLSRLGMLSSYGAGRFLVGVLWRL